MKVITKVILENEMDLILAHKQSMRLAELTGLSLALQTTFATAVSEVSRNAIGRENSACLTLLVSNKNEKQKYLTAILEDKRAGFSTETDEGYRYAKKLVQHISAVRTAEGNRMELHYRLPATLRLDDHTTERWTIILETDPDISPYEEIKRKNRQLIEMADRLRDSEQQYRLLTDSLPIMIFTMNNDGKLTYMNKWLHDYTGQAIEEINETRWANIVHPDDFGEIWENWAVNAASGDAVMTPERRLLHAESGQYRWHTGVAIPITDGSGNVRCWNSFMVDIHAQKLIEATLKDNKELKDIHEELQKKVEELNQSNQQLEQFAYVASHDLQEPLRKITFYSDFLNKKYGPSLPAEASSFFNNLMNATERMKLLVQDILAYSTVQNEGFVLVDLNDVVRDALQDLEIGIEERGAEIRVDELPEVEGNSRQLKQLFENLLSNSLKFSQKDRKLDVSITAVVNEHEVKLSFADNGIGFEQIYINKMFDIFQRLHGREKYAGTGIGLAICKKIVTTHNGAITAEGVPGEGATFFITLPLRQHENHVND